MRSAQSSKSPLHGQEAEWLCQMWSSLGSPLNNASASAASSPKRAGRRRDDCTNRYTHAQRATAPPARGAQRVAPRRSAGPCDPSRAQGQGRGAVWGPRRGAAQRGAERHDPVLPFEFPSGARCAVSESAIAVSCQIEDSVDRNQVGTSANVDVSLEHVDLASGVESLISVE